MVVVGAAVVVDGLAAVGFLSFPERFDAVEAAHAEIAAALEGAFQR